MKMSRYILMTVAIFDTLLKTTGQTSTYKTVKDRFCVGQNDIYQSEANEFTTVAECQKKCTDSPKCVSAEWYADAPTQCDLSSTCTLKKTRDAPKAWGVMFLVKKQQHGPAPIAPPRGRVKYAAVKDRYCSKQNDIYQSKANEFKTAAECQKKCTDSPKCVSAEWYADAPTQCDLSSTCTEANAIDAPKAWGVMFLVKKQQHGPAPIAPPRGTRYKVLSSKYCKAQNDIYQSEANEFTTAAECQEKCTDSPKCVSAEWYAGAPTQCDLSSTCTEANAIDAPKNWGVEFLVRENRHKSVNHCKDTSCMTTEFCPGCRNYISCTSCYPGCKLRMNKRKGFYDCKPPGSSWGYTDTNDGGVVVVHGRNLRSNLYQALRRGNNQ